MNTLDVHRLPYSDKEIAAKPASWFHFKWRPGSGRTFARLSQTLRSAARTHSDSFLVTLWMVNILGLICDPLPCVQSRAPPVAPAFSLDRLSTTRKLTAFWERGIIRRCTHSLTSHTAIHNARSRNNMALKCVNCMRACVRTGRTHLLLRSSLLQVSLVVAGR